MLFKLYWKNDTSTLIEGTTIAEAFNNVGYTKDHINSLLKYEIVITPSNNTENLNNVLYSCKVCKSTPVVNITKDKLYTISCPLCESHIPYIVEFETYEDSLLYWNAKQL